MCRLSLWRREGVKVCLGSEGLEPEEWGRRVGREIWRVGECSQHKSWARVQVISIWKNYTSVILYLLSSEMLETIIKYQSFLVKSSLLFVYWIIFRSSGGHLWYMSQQQSIVCAFLTSWKRKRSFVYLCKIFKQCSFVLVLSFFRWK